MKFVFVIRYRVKFVFDNIRLFVLIYNRKKKLEIHIHILINFLNSTNTTHKYILEIPKLIKTSLQHFGHSAGTLRTQTDTVTKVPLLAAVLIR